MLQRYPAATLEQMFRMELVNALLYVATPSPHDKGRRSDKSCLKEKVQLFMVGEWTRETKSK